MLKTGCFGDITKDNCPKIKKYSNYFDVPPPLWGAIMTGLLGAVRSESSEKTPCPSHGHALHICNLTNFDAYVKLCRSIQP